MRVRLKVWQGKAIGALQQTILALGLCVFFGLSIYWMGNTFFCGVFFILGFPFVWDVVGQTVYLWEQAYEYYANFGKRTHQDWLYTKRDQPKWTWKHWATFLQPGNLLCFLISERVEEKALDEPAVSGKLREQSNIASATGDQSESPPQS